ncbi:MAG: hypothetical protein AAF849_04845 [Bacteroidota bacterium]
MKEKRSYLKHYQKLVEAEYAGKDVANIDYEERYELIQNLLERLNPDQIRDFFEDILLENANILSELFPVSSQSDVREESFGWLMDHVSNVTMNSLEKVSGHIYQYALEKGYGDKSAMVVNKLYALVATHEAGMDANELIFAYERTDDPFEQMRILLLLTSLTTSKNINPSLWTKVDLKQKPHLAPAVIDYYRKVGEYDQSIKAFEEVINATSLLNKIEEKEFNFLYIRVEDLLADLYDKNLSKEINQLLEFPLAYDSRRLKELYERILDDPYFEDAEWKEPVKKLLSPTIENDAWQSAYFEDLNDNQGVLKEKIKIQDSSNSPKKEKLSDIQESISKKNEEIREAKIGTVKFRKSDEDLGETIESFMYRTEQQEDDLELSDVLMPLRKTADTYRLLSLRDIFNKRKGNKQSNRFTQKIKLLEGELLIRGGVQQQSRTS